MQALELVGYTADLSYLVVVDPSTGERFKLPVVEELIGTLTELLELGGDQRAEALQDLGNGHRPPIDDISEPTPPLPSSSGEEPVAAALLSVGRAMLGSTPKPKVDGSASRLTPSEIQRLLRAGKAPESVAEQAGVSLDWVLRWYQPIEAEQRKVITSVRGGRQEREGFGLSDALIGASVRTNLLARDVEPDGDDVQWSAARPEGRPYWTVTLKFRQDSRVCRATWRYDIGTGRVTPRDDLANDLGWTAPITHPTPGRMHLAGADVDRIPPRQAAPPPPPPTTPARWEPPTPPDWRRPQR